MQKRRLNDMAVTFGILDDGTERAQLRLFFSKGLRNQVKIPVSIGVAARMRHPDDCPHRGVPPGNKLPRARRRKRKWCGGTRCTDYHHGKSSFHPNISRRYGGWLSEKAALAPFSTTLRRC
jgi:hypothetical protein